MKYILKGLDCPNCAAKIEKKVNNLKAVKHATLAFATQTLELELKVNSMSDALFLKDSEITSSYVIFCAPKTVPSLRVTLKYIRTWFNLGLIGFFKSKKTSSYSETIGTLSLFFWLKSCIEW